MFGPELHGRKPLSTLVWLHDMQRNRKAAVMTEGTINKVKPEGFFSYKTYQAKITDQQLTMGSM